MTVGCALTHRLSVCNRYLTHRDDSEDTWVLRLDLGDLMKGGAKERRTMMVACTELQSLVGIVGLRLPVGRLVSGLGCLLHWRGIQLGRL